MVKGGRLSIPVPFTGGSGAYRLALLSGAAIGSFELYGTVGQPLSFGRFALPTKQDGSQIVVGFPNGAPSAGQIEISAVIERVGA